MGKINGKYIVRTVFALLLLSAMASMQSCSDSACLDNKSAIPLAGFYDSSTRRAIKVDSLQIGGVNAPNDSLLLDNKSADEVFLPMRSAYTSTSFYIHYTSLGLRDPALNDTLVFDYESLPYFASDECGAMYIYRVRKFSYTRHLIDSIGIVDSLITNANKQYMHIYFRTTRAAGEAAAL